ATLLLIVVLCVQQKWIKVAAAGVAMWLHLEHVMVLPFVAVECGVLGAAVAAALGASCYAWCAFGGMKLGGPREAAHWTCSARHGFQDPAWKAPGAAVFGAARTVAVAPYPYEAPIGMCVAQALVGGAAIAIILFAARKQPAPLGLSRRAIVALVVPYVAFGML